MLEEKTLWKVLFFYILSVFLLLILLPASLVGGWWRWESRDGSSPLDGMQAKFFPASETGTQSLKIYCTAQEKMMDLPLEEYIAGVVAAEMPASFHPEALKAQAVIARTYSLVKARRGGCTVNPGADLCTDSTCCQAWDDIRAVAEKWPEKEASFYLERVLNAVESTRGMVLMYREELAQTVYHSTCGGETEAAADVWSGGGDVPYLQSVECSFCRHSPHYTGEQDMDPASYAGALRKESGVLPVLGEGNIPLMEVVSRSGSGRNTLLRIGSSGRLYRGEEIRHLLGLPSTYFRWQAEGDRIIFYTRGYGHGVGLCQYGADGMASQGYSFPEILQFYYRGTEVRLLNN